MDKQSDKYAIFYACMLDDDEAGVYVDYLYYGGTAQSEEEADLLMKSLTQDRSLQGPGNAVISRKYKLDIPLIDILNKAKKQFKRFADDIYDMEDMQTRMKGKKFK
jgi:hypothetical protein